MTTKPPRGVPRDEWLLAVGLARYPSTADGLSERVRQMHPMLGVTHRIATAISDMHTGHSGSDWSASYDGAGVVTGEWYDDAEESWRSNRDAYYAGAGLAMALESE